MRKLDLILVAASLMIAIPSISHAQAPQKQDPPSSAPATLHADATHDADTPDSKPASSDATPSSDAPMSLGEIARLARAKKASQAKSVKIFDDDNMPRAPIAAGEKAPGYSSDSSSGGGKVILLDFWATWCGPCRHALPELKQLASVYGGSDFELVSVNEDDDEPTWRQFVAQNGMTWTQRLDPGHQMMRQYGANGLPTYVLIGKDGTVIQQYVGDDPAYPMIERAGPDIKRALSQRP